MIWWCSVFDWLCVIGCVECVVFEWVGVVGIGVGCVDWCGVNVFGGDFF